MSTLTTPKKIFEDLTTAQRRFLLEKDMATSKTVGEWLQFLRPIVAYDVLLDASTRRLKLALRLLLAMGAFNIAVAAMIGNLWVGLLGAAMGLMGFYQWGQRLGNEKRDLDNQLRLYFFPLLIALDQDGKGDWKVDAAFHLRQKDLSPVAIEARITNAGSELRLSIGKGSYEIVKGEQQLGGQLSQASEFVRCVREQIS